ncbi:MAG TPA: hypothetical protein VFC45_08990 [Pseudolabrys sp.]|nr:hypothetical protein [Pseudolabrys sp.]
MFKTLSAIVIAASLIAGPALAQGSATSPANGQATGKTAVHISHKHAVKKHVAKKHTLKHKHFVKKHSAKKHIAKKHVKHLKAAI